MAFAMLLTLEPITRIFLAIRPSEDAIAFFQIFDVAAAILTAILPGEDSFAVHHVVDPLA